MFGSHLSISGGMHNALLEAERLTFGTVQVFTKNQQQWAAKPLADSDIAVWKSHVARLGFRHVVAHDSYLINLATADAALRAKSVAAFGHEMARCDQLGIPYLVTHPGAHLGAGEAEGVARVVAAFDEILAEQPAEGVTVCVETTAGQGSSLGWRFEHLRDILAGVKRPERFAVCIDTCHILAAGYDITTAEGTRKVLEEFERVVGLKHVKVWHFNDSLKPLGSRVDRHAHIGRGFVGLAAFGVIAREERFRAVPKILETPKDKAPDGRDWDTWNLEVLHALSRGETVELPPVEEKPKPAKKAKK